MACQRHVPVSQPKWPRKREEVIVRTAERNPNLQAAEK